MNRFKNQLIAAAVLSMLAIIGTIMNSHQAAAQGPPGGLAVNIVNPLPVPVTGSITVAGTMAATQSGSWNVGITGPIVNVDSPGRHPYQATFENSSGGTLLFQSPVVPPNHRLVLQQISAYTLLNNQFNPAPNDLTIGIQHADGPHVGDPFFVFPVTPLPDDPPVSTLVAPLTAYVDAGKAIRILISHVPAGNFTASGTLSGYMVDCSVAACDALIP
jgi:hypothetical protein